MQIFPKAGAGDGGRCGSEHDAFAHVLYIQQKPQECNFGGCNFSARNFRDSNFGEYDCA